MVFEFTPPSARSSRYVRARPVSFLEGVTRFIQSPLGQLAAGGALAGVIWKFFERVESVLTEQAKAEIGVWLLSRASITSSAERIRLIPSSVAWMEKISKTIIPTERSLAKTWKLVGIFTCILAAVSLLYPHSISRQILAVDVKDGGFDAEKVFGLFFFTSLFAAIGTHISFLATRLLAKRIAATNWTDLNHASFAVAAPFMENGRQNAHNSKRQCSMPESGTLTRCFSGH
jgi:hypothetical protein